ncbi:MAG: prolipoprotein diacylglyceryl transferase, partial [Bacteroides sp.]|nr:prolipoprotein diacylglyceryl transferase [Bacteroides sp.]
MLPLLSIHWNPDPVIIDFGVFALRYYGLLWIVGLALAYFIVRRQYRDRRIGDDKFEPLFFYCFFGILIGARLG